MYACTDNYAYRWCVIRATHSRSIIQGTQYIIDSMGLYTGVHSSRLLELYKMICLIRLVHYKYEMAQAYETLSGSKFRTSNRQPYHTYRLERVTKQHSI